MPIEIGREDARAMAPGGAQFVGTLSSKQYDEEQKPRILYADEDRDNREFIVRDLVDYDVVCAMTTADALREGRSGGFDLILLDDRLSGATGIEICQEIRALDRWTPILILSGPDDKIMRDKAAKVGAQDYWPTPVDMEAVGREIRRLIELKRSAMRASGSERKRESGAPGAGEDVFFPAFQ